MTSPDPLLRLQSLRKEFSAGGRSRRRLLREASSPFVAVRDVDLTLSAGETLAVVGESGSGKSTLGRMVLGLTESTSGSIWFDERDITHLPRRGRKLLTRDIQVIFQDPYASLNPRQQVADIIREPLDIHDVGTPGERRRRVLDLMDRVALAPRYAKAYPHELSGGMRQRVGIATAIALSPKVVVADEPVSALDVSVQAQILELLTELQREASTAMLFVSHDLGVVKQVSDRVAVMCHGELVEVGDAAELYAAPQHPYTKALLSAVPSADPRARYDPIVIAENQDASADIGCLFRARCWLAEPVCAEVHPLLTARPNGNHARCHVTERSPDVLRFRRDATVAAGESTQQTDVAPAHRHGPPPSV